LNKQLEQEHGVIKKANERTEHIKNEIEGLEEELKGNEQVARKNNLEQALEDATKKKNGALEAIKKIYDQVSTLSANLSSLDQILSISDYVEHGLLVKLQELTKNSSKNNTETWTQQFEPLTEELNLLLDKDSAFLEELREIYSKYNNEYKNLKEKTDEMDDDVKAFSLTGTSSYPNQQDIAILKEYYPEADPTPLCELLDITNREWQGAIEGFMGNNRFAIVVKEGYETEATDLLKSKRLKSKIVQGSKLLDDISKISKEVKSDSIVSLMKFHSDIAEAYMKLNYANVMKCTTTYELTQARRGLKADGLAASGYTTFECLASKSNCYIGEAARYDRYVELKKQLDENKKELSKLKALRDKADRLYKNLMGVSFQDFNIKLLDLEQINLSVESLNAQIDSLDISDLEEKLLKIEYLKKERKIEEDKEKLAIKNTGSFETQITAKKNAIENLKREISNLQELVKKQEEELHAVNFELSRTFSQWLTELETEAQNSYKNIEPMPIFDQITKDKITKYETLVIHHNDECAEIAKIEDLNFELVKKDTTEAFIALYNYLQKQQATKKKISENILKKKSKELSSAKDTFDKTFKDEFCKTVYNSIIDGREKVRRLNVILKRHKFDNERFVIKEPFIQQFKEYYEYFEYVVHANKDSLGFDKTQLPAEHIETKEKIEKLLLDTQNSEAEKELKVISDYRNYKDYDIHKIFNNDDENSISLTDLATDSGGQATTSYYIIRSIAAYSAFNANNRGNKNGGVGFLMVDEAFNRVDDGRTSDIIRYLKDDLGFQMIAAMPTKDESVLMPYATDRYSIYKVTEDSNYNSFKVHQHVDYTIINNQEVSDLMKAEENKIRKEVSLFE
ncbi:MAG: SbcC/MukB-like Walker B domain-containing protein, partial [Sulfurimonas sp.]